MGRGVRLTDADVNACYLHTQGLLLGLLMGRGRGIE